MGIKPAQPLQKNTQFNMASTLASIGMRFWSDWGVWLCLQFLACNYAYYVTGSSRYAFHVQIGRFCWYSGGVIYGTVIIVFSQIWWVLATSKVFSTGLPILLLYLYIFCLKHWVKRAPNLISTLNFMKSTTLKSGHDYLLQTLKHESGIICNFKQVFY